jgi:hypothetical protein
VLLDVWDKKIAEEGFWEMAIESSYAIRAGLLPLHHRAPFDRVLAAQAQITGWPIISADRIFDFYRVLNLSSRFLLQGKLFRHRCGWTLPRMNPYCLQWL